MWAKPKEGDTIAVWFSCGAASAVAAKCAVKLWGSKCNIRVVNNPVLEEHFDNRRFLRDVEQWIGVKIELATNNKFPDDILASEISTSIQSPLYGCLYVSKE